MSTNIFPQTLQIVEKIMVLMDPENEVIDDLRRFKMFEKVPLIILYCEGWPNFEEYRYQPRTVAFCIAKAEVYKYILEDFQTAKKSANGELENARRRLKTKIERISKVTGIAFDDLPSDIKISSFYNNKEALPDILKYWTEHELIEDATDRRARLLKEREPITKPVEKPLNDFCRDMADLFKAKGFRTSYKLIANIVNLFKLSNNRQSYDSIKKRFSRHSIK